MHTTDGKSEGVYFFHNGNYSGEIIVVLPAATANMELSHQDHTVRVTIPSIEDLEAIVSNKYRGEMIERAEKAEDGDILSEAYGHLRTPEAFVKFVIDLEHTAARKRITLQDIIDEAKWVNHGA